MNLPEKPLFLLFVAAIAAAIFGLFALGCSRDSLRVEHPVAALEKLEKDGDCFSDEDSDPKQMKEWENTLAQLKARIKNDSHDAEAYNRLGYFLLDRLEEQEQTEANSATRLVVASLFRKALSIDPSSLNGLLGTHLMEAGTNPKDTQKLIEAVKAGNFQFAGVPIEAKNEGWEEQMYLALAGSYSISGSRVGTSRALELSKETLRRFPTNPKGYIQAARYSLDVGDMEQARQFAQDGLRIAQQKQYQQDILEAKQVLGNYYTKVGQYDQAEKLFREISVQEDGSPWACAYQALGGLYRTMGKTSREAETLIEMSDLFPATARYAYEAALACFSTGDNPRAMKYVDRALNVEAHSDFSVLKAHLLLFAQRYEEAESVLKEIKEREPNNRGADVGLGHLSIIRQNYPRALSLLQAVADSPGITDAFTFRMAGIGMGWALSNQNRHEEAVGYFERILKEDQNNILGMLGKANGLIGLNRLVEAEVVFKNVLEMQPGNPYALAELGIIHYKRGQDKDAERAFQEALSKDRKNYTCPYEGLGLLYLKQGKIDKAKSNLKKAIKLNPDIEFKKFNALAKIYIQEGRFKEARELLKKSMENFPYDDEAKNLLEGIKNKS